MMTNGITPRDFFGWVKDVGSVDPALQAVSWIASIVLLAPAVAYLDTLSGAGVFAGFAGPSSKVSPIVGMLLVSNLVVSCLGLLLFRAVDGAHLHNFTEHRRALQRWRHETTAAVQVRTLMQAICGTWALMYTARLVMHGTEGNAPAALAEIEAVLDNLNTWLFAMLYVALTTKAKLAPTGARGVGVLAPLATDWVSVLFGLATATTVLMSLLGSRGGDLDGVKAAQEFLAIVVLLLVVGRLDSQRLALPGMPLAMLVLYAAVQSRGTEAGVAITSTGGTPPVVLAAMLVIAVGKMFLVLAIAWMLDTGRLHFFAHSLGRHNDAATQARTSSFLEEISAGYHIYFTPELAEGTIEHIAPELPQFRDAFESAQRQYRARPREDGGPWRGFSVPFPSGVERVVLTMKDRSGSVQALTCEPGRSDDS